MNGAVDHQLVLLTQDIQSSAEYCAFLGVIVLEEVYRNVVGGDLL
jgi:hypothetical protein